MSKDHKEIIKNANKLDKLVFFCMIVSCFVGVAGYIFGPIVKNIVNLLIYGIPWKYELFLKTEYFYEITTLTSYCLSYFIQCLDCTLGAVYNVRKFNLI